METVADDDVPASPSYWPVLDLTRAAPFCDLDPGTITERQPTLGRLSWMCLQGGDGYAAGEHA